MCVCTGLHIVDFHNFQSLFLHKPKTRNMEIIPEEKRRPRSSTSEEGFVLGSSPTCAQTPGIAFGIRDLILLLFCEPSALACSIKPAFSYKRHLVQTPLSEATAKVFCTFSTAQCEPVLTGTTHGDSVANKELFFPFFFKESNCTQEMLFLLCAARGHRSEVCVFVCVCGCRLRFSTRSVVGQSLHNSPSRFCLGLFSILLLQDGQFFKTMNAKKPDTVCHNTFSPVEGSAALCKQDRGANHSSYQGTSEGLQVWMVMASFFFFFFLHVNIAL